MNYKVRVQNEAESKEAQELFFELGYKWPNGKVENLKINEYPTIIRSHTPGSMTWSLGSERYYKEHKEITLPELRDLVVLKRNSVWDYTHGSSSGSKFYHCCNGDVYVFNDGSWVFDHTKALKPIEKKEMKEYLVKNENTGAYDLFRKYPDFSGESDIEIPEGAIKAYLNNSRTINFVNSDDDFRNEATKGEWISTHRGKHDLIVGHELVWCRHTQPEELPFIDNEPLLNDQYADIEKVRKNAVFGRALSLPDFEPFKPDSLIDSLIDSNLSESKYLQLNNSDINFRVAKAFNEIRGTYLTEDDLDFIRKLIDLTVSHYLKIED